jgi:hypothetical protein
MHCMACNCPDVCLLSRSTGGPAASRRPPCACSLRISACFGRLPLRPRHPHRLAAIALPALLPPYPGACGSCLRAAVRALVAVANYHGDDAGEQDERHDGVEACASSSCSSFHWPGRLCMLARPQARHAVLPQGRRKARSGWARSHRRLRRKKLRLSQGWSSQCHRPWHPDGRRRSSICPRRRSGMQQDVAVEAAGRRRSHFGH